MFLIAFIMCASIIFTKHNNILLACIPQIPYIVSWLTHLNAEHKIYMLMMHLLLSYRIYTHDERKVVCETETMMQVQFFVILYMRKTM